MKKPIVFLFAILFNILFLSSCKNDLSPKVIVSYFAARGDDGKRVIEANISNRSGSALTNIKIDFSTPDNKTISYTFTGVLCSAQNIDVKVNSDTDFENINAYKVNSCEETVCPQ